MKRFTIVPELQATAHHIAAVQAKLDALEAAKGDSWSQILTRAADLYRRGRLTEVDLYGLLSDMRDSFGSGFGKVWDAHIPVSWRRIQTAVERLQRITPNGPEGSWHGTFPIGPNDPYPPYGMPVVYVLFDGTNEPVYVGSTEGFRSRMAPHVREKPGLTRWAAYPCRDREHAYEVEDRVLREHLPHLNRKASR